MTWRAATPGISVALEAILLFWIRDSLTLNILMFIHPIRAVALWQLGR